MVETLFDEKAYLAANPDVADAVRAGLMESGAFHYTLCGQNEGRRLRPKAPGAVLEAPFANGELPNSLVDPSFDETSYLYANPDVANAVRAGLMESGAYHYALVGRKEGRQLRPNVRSAPLKLPFAKGATPNRRDKVLAGLDLNAQEGLEIGALASPMVHPAEGKVFFVDHADTATLREKYASDGTVAKDNIVDVGAVWGNSTLQDCIGVERKVDYVVASHVIEHVPDLITWLTEIHSVLRKDGSLRLAIPDRRYTFDYLRFESQPHDVLEAWLRKARAPLPRHILEHCNMVCEVDVVRAWKGKLDAAQLRRHFPKGADLEYAQNALRDGNYFDCHCWVFTPLSFATLCLDLAERKLIGFSCAFYCDTARNELEFFVHMKKSEDPAEIEASWRGMQRALT